MDLATKYQDKLRAFEPIGYEGLKFYPLQVKEYALYHIAKPAMELMLSSLPLRYVRLSWVQALEALDREADEKGIRTGYLTSLLILLDAALHTNVRNSPNAMMIARDESGAFGAVVIRQEGGEPVVLSAKHFADVRQILAAQNGYDIPDENWNPDLVRAQTYLREQASGSMRGGYLEDAVFALAAATGMRSKEIWEWPIREFEQMRDAVDRRLRFQICSTAELSGQIKFKNGNPYPTWIWEIKSELPHGFQRLKDLDAGANGLLDTNDKE